MSAAHAALNALEAEAFDDMAGSTIESRVRAVRAELLTPAEAATAGRWIEASAPADFYGPRLVALIDKLRRIAGDS